MDANPAQRFAAVREHPAITGLRPETLHELRAACETTARFADLAPAHQEQIVVAERRIHVEEHGRPLRERASSVVGGGLGLILVGVIVVLTALTIVVVVVDLAGAALTGGVIGLVVALVIAAVVLFVFLVVTGGAG